MNNETVSKNKEGKSFFHENMKNISYGFFMTLLTFNFWGLQYILPTIGAVLLYVGFRDLRNENKAFNIAWIFSIITLVFNVMNLIYVTTPLNVHLRYSTLMIVITSIFQLSFLIVFREGMKDIFEKACIDLDTDPILKLIIWNIILIFCIVTQLGQLWFIGLALICYYFYVLNAVYNLSYDLEESTYKVKEDKKGISKNILLLLYIVVCVFVASLCSFKSNHIHLNSMEEILVEMSEERNNLISKGFPEEILKDISDEDVYMLQEAAYINSSTEELDFNIMPNSGGAVEESESSNKNLGNAKLKATNITIEFKDGKIYCIEHFNWKEGKAYWRDEFSISGSEPFEPVNGRLLYEKEGINYIAPMPRLELDKEGYMSMILGSINYPLKSEKQRGYVLYKVNTERRGTIRFNNIINYMHFISPFRIPYEEAEFRGFRFDHNLRQHVTLSRINEPTPINLED